MSRAVSPLSSSLRNVSWWDDFWERRALSFGIVRAQADPATISNVVPHNAIALAQSGCSFDWAALVFSGNSCRLMAGAPVEVQSDELLLALHMQQRATFEAVPSVLLACEAAHWFACPTDQICPHNGKSP